MSTTARKRRKRLRRAALDAGYTALAESLRFQRPRRASAAKRTAATKRRRFRDIWTEYILGRRTSAGTLSPHR